MKLLLMATRLSLHALIPALTLALLAVGAGRLLPAGEQLLLTLPGNFRLGVYLFDLEHRLLYPIKDEAPGQYAPKPADGDWIVYSDNPSGNWDIYLTNIYTGETRRLTADSSFDGRPAWSADGRWIAFLSNRGGPVNIYAVAAGGGLPKRLSRGVASKDHPAWSPDGSRIVYEVRESSGVVNLYVTDVSCLADNLICPQNVMQLTSSVRGDYFPAWSPDGRWIAFISDRGGRGDVYIVDTACLETTAGCIQQNARQLTRGIRATRGLSWSSDGQSLRFIAEITNQPTLYSIPFGCDLLPDGCVPQVLLTATP